MCICMDLQITFIESRETRALLIAVLQKQFYRASLWLNKIRYALNMKLSLRINSSIKKKRIKIKEFKRTFISSRNCETAIKLPVKLTSIAPHICSVFTTSFIRSTDVSQYNFQHYTTVLRVMSSQRVYLISHTVHANRFNSYDRLIPRPRYLNASFSNYFRIKTGQNV